MNTTELQQHLKDQISAQEYNDLKQGSVRSVSDFNRKVLLELLEADVMENSEEIKEDDVKKLTNILEQFLGRYLADNPGAWKWIVISCIYLGFVKKKPFHARNLVQYQVKEEEGEVVYFCPAKAEEEDTACSFCVCRHI